MRQRLGQHFLIDESVLQKIAEAINSQLGVLRQAQDENKIIIEELKINDIEYISSLL